MSLVSQRSSFFSIHYSRESRKRPRGFFAAGGQTNGFSQFKADSIFLPMFPHCGSFSIGPLRPLPHAKLSSTNLKIGTCRVNFSV